MKNILIFLMLLFYSGPAFANTASDIKALKPFHWYAIPNSALSKSGVYPNPVPPGIEGPSAVMADWSGGTYDTKRNRLLIWGGGHNGYAGNEIYAFSMNTFTWSRIWGPTPNDQIGTDRIVYNVYGDGSPGARHTANSLNYIPEPIDAMFGFGYSIWRSGTPIDYGRPWLFHFSNNTWENNAKIDVKYNGGGSWSSVYDPTTGHIFVRCRNGWFEYNPTDGTFVERYHYLQWWDAPTPIFHNNKIYSLGRYKASGFLEVFDLSNYSLKTYTSNQFSGDTRIFNSDDSPGFVYDSAVGKFVAWSGHAGTINSTDVYEIDPTQMTSTRIQAAKDNTVIPTDVTASGGTFGRFQYIPSMNLFILVNAVNQNVYVYKLSAVLPSKNIRPVNGEIMPAPENIKQSAKDITPPTVTAFTPFTPYSKNLNVPITTFKATDNIGVTGYCVTDEPIPPASDDPAWSASPPAVFTVRGKGVWDLYPWAKDAAGNISRYTDAVATVEVQCVTKTVNSAGGADYTAIAPAIAWANSHGPGSIVQIDAAGNPYESWRGGVAGTCASKGSDNTNNVIGNITANGVTIRGINGKADIRFLCHNPMSAAEDWGVGGNTSHGSMIVMKEGVKDLRIENLKVHGAGYSGTGLWVEPEAGAGLLYLKNDEFYDNSGGGLLTGVAYGLDVVSVGSQFYHNARTYVNNGQIHNIYVGEVNKFVFLNSVSRECYNGQLIKSRARKNYILYSRITDEGNRGNGLCSSLSHCSNYPIDLPYGGESYVIGNEIEESAKNLNGTFISFNSEQRFTVYASHGTNGPVLYNSTFDNNTAGWTPSNCTITSISGGKTNNCLQLAATGGASQKITFSANGLTKGQYYEIQLYAKSGTTGNEPYSILLGNTGLSKASTTASWVLRRAYFKAMNKRMTISIRKKTATIGTMLFDDFKIIPTIRPGSILYNERTGNNWIIHDIYRSSAYGFRGSFDTGNATCAVIFTGYSSKGFPNLQTDIQNGDILSSGGASIIVTAPKSETVGRHLQWSFGTDQAENGLYMVNNTFINHFVANTYPAYAIFPHGDTAFVIAKNNLFVDLSRGLFPMEMTPSSESKIVEEENSRWLTVNPGFVDINNFDCRLTAVAAKIIGTGSNPGHSKDYNLAPMNQYKNVASATNRTVKARPYIGAYEIFHRPFQSSTMR